LTRFVGYKGNKAESQCPNIAIRGKKADSHFKKCQRTAVDYFTIIDYGGMPGLMDRRCGLTPPIGGRSRTLLRSSTLSAAQRGLEKKMYIQIYGKDLMKVLTLFCQYIYS